MGRGTGTQGRPIQGISQQPEKTRLQGQCTESINFRPDVVKGLRTRTGSNWVALTKSIKETDKVFFYRRDEVESYFIVIPSDRNTGIWIIDTKGKQHNINVTGSVLDYVYAGNVKDLITSTIADTTFIANPSVVITKDTNKSPAQKYQAVVYCQYIDFSQTQRVFCDNSLVASYSSKDGTNASDPTQKASVRTSVVAQSLVDQINSSTGSTTLSGTVESYRTSQGGFTYGYPVSADLDFSTILEAYNETTGVFIPKPLRFIHNNEVLADFTGHAVHPHVVRLTIKANQGVSYKATYKENDNAFIVERINGLDFTIRTSDDANGDNLVAIKDTLTDLSKLPPIAPIGMVIEIRPLGGTDIEAYWLEAKAKLDEVNRVYWQETIKPQSELGFNSETMPINLIRETFVNGLATFKLAYASYGKRGVGSEDSNTNPSFVGSTITSIGSFQNRLMVTSGETLIMSRSSEFYDFYKTTTQSVLDGDPYEIYSDSERITNLRSPINFNGDLVFFSDTAQVGLSGDKIVSPNNLVPLRLNSSFEVQPKGQPVSAGESIYFPFNYGQFTGIREYFVDSITDTRRARPITDHVNQLIKGEVVHMASSTSLNVLAVLSSYDRGILYIYDWLWQGQEKVQSAWGKWEFLKGTVIKYFEFIESELFMIYEFNNTSHLIRFDMGEHPDNIDTRGKDTNFSLDHKTFVSATRSGDHFVLSDSDFDHNIDASNLKMVLGTGGYKDDIGVLVDFHEQSDGSFILEGDLAPDGVNSIQILAGITIKAKYQPTNPYPKDQDGSARSGLDRMQIGRYFINYDQSGDCKAIVKNLVGSQREVKLYPRVIGNGFNYVGYSPTTEGVHKVPIRSKSNRYTLEITTESEIPLQIREFEYEANYSRRGTQL